MKSEFDLTEDMKGNLVDEFSNVFVIECVKGLQAGIVRMVIDVAENRKYLRIGMYVSFSDKKVKWRSKPQGDRFLAVVNSRWVKAFNHDPKFPVVVPVLVSKLNEKNERVYHEELIEMEMTYNQYIKRRLSIDFAKFDHIEMIAYENHKAMIKKYNDYYRALNSTSKHYRIKHDRLKTVISLINNAKKKYKKEWIEFKTQYLENKFLERHLDEMADQVREKRGKVIDLRDIKF